MAKHTPTLSVIIPVYNAEPFLTLAIESVLNQTFTDFEVIAINDGSTDKSLSILKSLAKKDPRISVISRPRKGIVATLNEGVDSAKGKYIARMDSDDICTTTRFEKQVTYLESNPDCTIVCSTVELINTRGLVTGYWPEDIKHTTTSELRDFLPTQPCIAHPTVMAKTQFFKTFTYREVPAAEDYDLWLRALSAGLVIHKIKEPLLQYRIHDTSITQLASQSITPVRKVNIAKKSFLKHQLRVGKFSHVERAVLASLVRPALHSAFMKIKLVLALPLIARERLAINKLEVAAKRNKKQLLFIVPWLTMGGADKVVLDLTNKLCDEYDIHIVTTEESPNEWEGLFDKTYRISKLPDIVRFPANKQIYLADYVKKNNITVTINSNSLIGYESLPLIKKRTPGVRNFDILHGQGGKQDNGSAPKFSLPYRKYIEKGITVTNYLIDYMVEQYQVDPSAFVCIHNGIAPEKSGTSKSSNKYRASYDIAKKEIVISWIGRFSAEKQPLLALQIAKAVSAKHGNCKFIFAGDGVLRTQMEKFVKENNLTDRVFLPGMINDSMQLLRESDAMFMTSEMEGLPIAILESLASGTPVISSAVGGIPELIKDSCNGKLIEYNESVEGSFVKAMCELLDEPKGLQVLAKNATESAREFTINEMVRKYRDVIS